jgi:hypothetical protein
MMFVDDIEDSDYTGLQIHQAFRILKAENLAKYVLSACSQCEAASFFLQSFLRRLKIGVDLQEIAYSLEAFRADDRPLETISSDYVAARQLYEFWRTKVIQGNFFCTPGVDRSSTDSDQDIRARQTLWDRQPFAGLPEALRRAAKQDCWFDIPSAASANCPSTTSHDKSGDTHYPFSSENDSLGKEDSSDEDVTSLMSAAVVPGNDGQWE